MRVSEMKEPNERIRTMDRVIVPKYETVATCEIPECQSCLLSRAKQRKPRVVDTKPVKSAEGAISRDKYQSGDFVSMTSMWSGVLVVYLWVMERNLIPTCFMVALFFEMQRPNTFMSEIKSH